MYWLKIDLLDLVCKYVFVFVDYVSENQHAKLHLSRLLKFD